MSFLIFSVLSNVPETTFSCACLLIPFVPVVLFCPLCDSVSLSVLCLFVIIINNTYICSGDQL